MKSILYLGFAVPVSVQKEIELLDEFPHFATNKFSWSLVNSLKFKFDSICVISTAEIRNYPTVKKISFRTFCFQDSFIHGYFLGFLNIILLKHITRLINVIPLGYKLINKYKIKYILVHGTHTPFMLYALILKFFYGMKISLVLTDEHGAEVPNDGKFGNLFRLLDTWFMKALVKKFDSYICLSTAFITKYQLNNALVIPGIVNSGLNLGQINNRNFKSSNLFKIVFAGGLNKNNGVDNFLKAISNVDSVNISFHILGKGDLLNDVILAAAKDKRIVYEGVKHSSDLSNFLRSANLLINPRPINMDYSRFSFPSKLLEYMSTGVPVLTTKLESIPCEFNECLYFTSDDSPVALSKSIFELYNKTSEERNQIGEKARIISTQYFGEEAIGNKVYALITNQN